MFAFEEDTFLEHDDEDTVAFSEISHLLYQMQGQVFPNQEAAFLMQFADNIGRRVVVIFRELFLQQNIFIGTAVSVYNLSEVFSGINCISMLLKVVKDNLQPF